MKIKKNTGRRILCLLLGSLLLGGCGVSSGNKNVTEGGKTMELTDRQKQVLSDLGLPEDYDELTESQKEGITAIGEMLDYVDDKYGMEFCYAGYIAPGGLEEEELTAYPADGFPELDCFSVTRDGDGFEDTYMNIVVRDKTEELIADYVSEAAGGAKAKVICDIGSTDITDMDFAEEDLPGHVTASCMIFVDGESIDASAAEELPGKVQAWLTEEQIPGLNQLIVLKPGNFIHLTEVNYTDYLSSEYYSLREDCDVD